MKPGVRDPFAGQPPGYWQAVPAELRAALDGSPALHPDSVPHLWDALQLRFHDPLGRLAPTYPEAMMQLAEGIGARWRPGPRDRERLSRLRPGDPAGAAWFVVLMVLHSSGPLSGRGTPARRGPPAARRRYGALWLESGGGGARTVAFDRIRHVTASTLRLCRRILRGPHSPEAWRVIRAMERGAGDLRKPLEERLHGQWVRAEKEGGLVLEARELLLALTMVGPPSPVEVTRLYADTLDGLASAVARRWKMRWTERARPTTQEEAAAGPGDALARFDALVYSESMGADPDEVRELRHQLRVDLVKGGLMAALAERALPGKIRRGRVYLEGGNPLRPAIDVDLSEYLRWLKTKAISSAEKELRRSAPLQGTGSPEVPATTSGQPPDPDPRVDALYAAARDDTDRALLDRLREGYTMSGAARQEGLSKAAGEKRFQRLKGRAGPG